MKFFLGIFTLALFSCSQGDSKKETDTKQTDTTKTVVTDTVIKPAIDTAALTITPQLVSGNPGYVTFSQKGKTLIYFDAKAKKGKIILNGKEHDLTSSTGTYTLTGDGITITTTGKMGEVKSDCAYGKAFTVTVKSGSQTLTLDNVDVQDCQGMAD